MSELLSSIEIEALLNAVSVGAVETEPRSAARSLEWARYDMLSRKHSVRHRVGDFDGQHDRFARLFQSTLSELLKQDVTVDNSRARFVSLQEYLKELGAPAAVSLFRISPSGGSLLFAMSGPLAYALVEAWYGGEGKRHHAPYHRMTGRDRFTPVERKMVEKIRGLFARDLEAAWKPDHALELEHVKTEPSPSLETGLAGTEPVAHVPFTVEWQGMSCSFSVVVPVAVLQHLLDSRDSRERRESAAASVGWRAHWVSELGLMSLDVRVTLGETMLRLGQVRAWKIGDVIPLLQNALEPLGVRVEEVQKFRGLMGERRGSHAVRLVGNGGKSS